MDSHHDRDAVLISECFAGSPVLMVENVSSMIGHQSLKFGDCSVRSYSLL